MFSCSKQTDDLNKLTDRYNGTDILFLHNQNDVRKYMAMDDVMFEDVKKF